MPPVKPLNNMHGVFLKEDEDQNLGLRLRHGGFPRISPRSSALPRQPHEPCVCGAPGQGRKWLPRMLLFANHLPGRRLLQHDLGTCNSATLPARRETPGPGTLPNANPEPNWRKRSLCTRAGAVQCLLTQAQRLRCMFVETFLDGGECHGCFH